MKLAHVTAVKVIGEYRLRLTFDDGLVGDVDFTGREWRGVFEPLADPSYFAQVEIDPEGGTVVWPNGADMAPDALHERVRSAAADPSSGPA